MTAENLHIAVVAASLRTGGAERAMLNLANGFFENGLTTDVVLVEKTGSLIPLLNREIVIHDLKKKHARYGIFSFGKYLKKNSPDVIIVTQLHVQLMVLVAIILSRWKGVVILNEQSTFSLHTNKSINAFIASFLFRRANAVTVVSHGAAADFIITFPSLKDCTSVIPNPVFIKEIQRLKKEKPDHPFFNESNIPVILSAGRLVAGKNFSLLIDAFSDLLKSTDARLIILGDGEERNSLEKKIGKMQLNAFVSLPGNRENPYAFMNRCQVFAFTSVYEGLPTVLIEALVCGCNIVSTACPHGPSEILDHGKYGTLVPVNDRLSLTKAMQKSLVAVNNKEEKIKRAEDFGIEKITGKYLELIKKLLSRA